MKTYRHLFFDLDNTLWDFDRNSKETLHELYAKHRLGEHGVESVDLFVKKYQERNAMMWEQYRLGKMDKETLRNRRFELTFWDMGIDVNGDVSKNLAHDYVNVAPKKEHLFPETEEVLEYLFPKYSLYIITNGFHEAQQVKLDASGIRKFFKRVFISEHTGFRKPDVNIFYYAQEAAKANADECLMIGDGLEIDVFGAINAGWDAVFFNPLKKEHAEKVNIEIANLKELKNML